VVVGFKKGARAVGPRERVLSLVETMVPGVRMEEADEHRVRLSVDRLLVIKSMSEGRR